MLDWLDTMSKQEPFPAAAGPAAPPLLSQTGIELIFETCLRLAIEEEEVKYLATAILERFMNAMTHTKENRDLLIKMIVRPEEEKTSPEIDDDKVVNNDETKSV